MNAGQPGLPILLIILIVPVLAVVGCQADTSVPATPTIEPERDVPSTELSPSATPEVAATPDAQSTPFDAVDEGGEVTNDSDSDGESGTRSEATSTASTGSADADVEYVRAVLSSGGAWTFHVTVRHPDTGWEDYANGWDVVTPDGQVLKASASDPFTRLLLHPHENEQPFTRSQGGIVIPDGTTTVIVRAHDLIDGFGGREITVDLTVQDGPGFEVDRQ